MKKYLFPCLCLMILFFTLTAAKIHNNTYYKFNNLASKNIFTQRAFLRFVLIFCTYLTTLSNIEIPVV